MTPEAGNLPTGIAPYFPIIASALADKIRQMDWAMFRSNERYGYGPIVTCDTEEERAGISSRRDDAWRALRFLAEVEQTHVAIRELSDLYAQDARRDAKYEEVAKTGLKHGTKVRFREPVMVPGPQWDGSKGTRILIPKNSGVYLGAVVNPNCEVVYRIKIRKGLVINVDPWNVEVA
jgi:hypothetical protein